MAERSHSLDDLQALLAAASADFSIKAVPLASAARWRLARGAISHETGGFFDLVGVEFESSPGQGQVFLYQPQSALTGLLRAEIGGERHFLMHARAAPGTQGVAQLGPTVQATPANYLMLHGGKALPYLGAFYSYSPGVRVLSDTMQFDLGERYFMKTKRSIVAQCSPEIPVSAHYTWVPERLVQQAALKSALFNPDLRSLLAVMPWGDSDAGEGLRPRSAAVCASLAQPLRPSVLGAVMAGLDRGAPKARFVDVDKLANWRLTDWGLFEIENRQGFDVQFYEVRLSGREVASWSQPLINSKSPGRAALYCRRTRGVLEVFACFCAEHGLTTGAALAPSYLRYPGRDRPSCSAFGEAAPDQLAGEKLACTIDPDEGERFYHDVSDYEVICLRDAGQEPAPGSGQWLTVAELKTFLCRSNFCSIQLRGLASMLLGIEPT